MCALVLALVNIAWNFTTIRETAASYSLQKRRLPPPPVGYIVRQKEQDRIAKFVERNEDGYLILVGPFACGKTSLVRAALHSMRGVLYCELKERSDAPMSNQILAALGYSDRSMSLKRVLLGIRRSGDPNWRPTLVITLGRKLTEAEAIDLDAVVRSLSSSVDNVARVIVESRFLESMCTLPKMSASFMVVNDFTLHEANTFLDARGMFVGDEQFRHNLFARVGTRPGVLFDLYVAMRRANAAAAREKAAVEAAARKNAACGRPKCVESPAILGRRIRCARESGC